MKASAAVTIYAPIDQVFDFIANIENNDQWINGVTEPAWTSVSAVSYTHLTLPTICSV